MQITIGQEEFDQAMSCWLDKQGFSPDKFNITVNVIAGRKFGTSAEINLVPKDKISRDANTKVESVIAPFILNEAATENVQVVPAVVETHKPIFNAE